MQGEKGVKGQEGPAGEQVSGLFQESPPSFHPGADTHLEIRCCYRWKLHMNTVCVWCARVCVCACVCVCVCVCVCGPHQGLRGEPGERGSTGFQGARGPGGQKVSGVAEDEACLTHTHIHTHTHTHTLAVSLSLSLSLSNS